jgi:membrane protein YdbS with pleckstrin-like domain
MKNTISKLRKCAEFSYGLIIIVLFLAMVLASFVTIFALGYYVLLNPGWILLYGVAIILVCLIEYFLLLSVLRLSRRIFNKGIEPISNQS